MAAANPFAAEAAIDTYVEQNMRRLHIPAAALAVVEADKVVHIREFGRAHAHGGPPTALTPFFIGSLTKSITGVVHDFGRGGSDLPRSPHAPCGVRGARPRARVAANTCGLTTAPHGAWCAAGGGTDVAWHTGNVPDFSAYMARICAGRPSRA